MKYHSSIFYIIHGAAIAGFSKLLPIIFNFSSDLSTQLYSSALGSNKMNVAIEQLGSNFMDSLSTYGVIIGLIVAVFGIIGLFLDSIITMPNKTIDKLANVEKNEENLNKINIKEINLYNTEDSELNKKVQLLLEKINKLLKINTIEKNYENKNLLENTKNNYLPKIIKQYIDTPINLRKVLSEKDISVYDMINKQLDIIMEGLLEVEKSLVNDKYHEMKVMERFLNDKFENNSLKIEEVKIMEKEMNV